MEDKKNKKLPNKYGQLSEAISTEAAAKRAFKALRGSDPNSVVREGETPKARSGKTWMSNSATTTGYDPEMAKGVEYDYSKSRKENLEKIQGTSKDASMEFKKKIKNYGKKK